MTGQEVKIERKRIKPSVIKRRLKRQQTRKGLGERSNAGAFSFWGAGQQSPLPSNEIEVTEFLRSLSEKSTSEITVSSSDRLAPARPDRGFLFSVLMLSTILAGLAIYHQATYRQAPGSKAFIENTINEPKRHAALISVPMQIEKVEQPEKHRIADLKIKRDEVDTILNELFHEIEKELSRKIERATAN